MKELISLFIYLIISLTMVLVSRALKSTYLPYRQVEISFGKNYH